MPKYLYHNQGENACGKKAMEYLPQSGPVIGQALIASEWRRLNGKHFDVADEVICGSCGRKMVFMVVEDVREEPSEKMEMNDVTS